MKFIKLKDSRLHAASFKTAVWNKLGVFPSPFHISTNSRLTLAKAFRNDHVATCSTALRSATEENESGSYVTVPCPFKVTQHSSTADWPKFLVTRLVTTEHIRNNYSLLKSCSV